MPRARITIERSPDGELLIFLNPEGCDRLIAELRALSEQNDHFHLWSHAWHEDRGIGSGVGLRVRAYDEEDEIVTAAKVSLRLDDWDRRHYPHVLDGDD
ncbi:MAG: hypothetical protein AB7J28_16575 [Hyphomonadaceae bacterium]